MKGKIEAWSFSRYKTHSECPRRAKYAYVDRLPEAPPSHAMLRGQMVHEACERYLKKVKGAKIPPEALNFKKEMQQLRRARKLASEDEWACTADWVRCNWMDQDVWLRAKVDAHYSLADPHMVIIDFKTGSVRTPPDEWAFKQRSLYALFAFMRYPQVQGVEVGMWYFDRPEGTNLFIDSYTRRGHLKRLRNTWERRAKKITSDRKFPAKPGNACSSSSVCPVFCCTFPNRKPTGWAPKPGKPPGAHCVMMNVMQPGRKPSTIKLPKQ